MDTIAKEIKENAELTLRAAGILLLVARVVNFHFPLPISNDQLDGISKQQLATWGSEWERKRAGIIAEAEAEAEHTQQEARTYAEALMLNSIAEGLQKAKEINPRLPHYVVAMRFLSTLQDQINKTSSEDEDQNEEHEKGYQKEPRDQISNHSRKEK